MRRCAACRVARPKRELIRLVRGPAGWSLDLLQRAGGRGTSLCPACCLAAIRGSRGRRDGVARAKGLRRAFRHEADDVVALLAEIEPTLATAAAATAVAPTDTAPSALAPAPTAPPRPNGGMHG